MLPTRASLAQLLAGLGQPEQLVLRIAQAVLDRVGAAMVARLGPRLPVALAVVRVQAVLEALLGAQERRAVGDRQAVNPRDLVGAPEAAPGRQDR